MQQWKLGIVSLLTLLMTAGLSFAQTEGKDLCIIYSGNTFSVIEALSG